MAPGNKHNISIFQKLLDREYKLWWDWLYFRSHLIFAIIVFIGMLVFIWWLTS